MAARNALGTFNTGPRDDAATFIECGVRGRLFKSVYKVTGNWAGSSLPWTRPDRRAYINGCDDEGHDGVQTSVWSGLDGVHQVQACHKFLFK